MTASMIDVIIILAILMGAVVGFKNGAIKTATKFVGLFVVIIVSFILKDSLMVIMYENLPFFNFFGLIRGVEAINILFYQLVSFVVIFLALTFVLRVLVVITGMVEWLLKKTIIFGIPSKILGLFVGALEYYVYLFIALYVFNMPVFGLTIISESNLAMSILDNTPILSELVDDTVEVYSDVWEVIKNRDDLSNKQVNAFVLATLLDNDLITIESARKLVESNHIVLEDNSILDKYEEDESFFEKIGGCLLIGGCDGESGVVDEVFRGYIYSDGDEYQVDDISFTVSYIGFNNCVGNATCRDDEKIEVGLVVNNGFREKEMVVITGQRYKWIVDTDNYIFAEIEDGHLIVGIAEYNGRWNIYGN